VEEEEAEEEEERKKEKEEVEEENENEEDEEGNMYMCTKSNQADTPAAPPFASCGSSTYPG
jgi:hypothetical protein